MRPTLLVPVVAGCFPSSGGPGESRDLTFDGDLVRFTVPSVPPGSYDLALGPSWVVRCNPHPASADIFSTFSTFQARHAFTIVP